MTISRYCIDRPIFASVISIVITIAGAVAMFNLPIAQYPDITPIQITVSATYPGASAEVVADNVAAPIEQQVNGADHMLYMSSASSSSGNLTLTAYFEIGTDPALAQVDVQNRVNLALPQLPSSVQAQGVQVQKKSSAFMMVIAVYSPDNRYDQTYIANYTNLYLLDAIKRIPGANQASIFGNPDYAMRIWLKPDRMAQLGITAADVQRAVANQNQQFAVGRVGQSPTGQPVEQSFAVTTQGRLTEPSEFENIIIRAESGSAAIVRLKDVGRAELGQKDYSTRGFYNGKPATIISVYQQPGANALAVSKAVSETLAEMKKSFPEGITYDIALDTTQFTRASIETVVHTFFEALILVVLVVFLFLQSLRATLIPIIAVPISIIGTAIGMTALGFSINMLTLFGMVLAIGIVVDDAIVVIESVEHNMAKLGLSPKEAAKKAMDEVGGALIAIVMVLCAVFVPVAFLSGITGQLYKQFAITIAISVVISGVVALTLSPALAALLLKPTHGEKNRFFRWFDAKFAQMTEGYTRVVRLAIKRSAIGLLLFAGMIGLAAWLMKTIPGSFLPPEDQGYLLGAVIMPDAASLDRTEETSRKATEFFIKDPATYGVAVVDGFSLLDNQDKSNAAVFFVGLKDFGERYSSANASHAKRPRGHPGGFSRILQGARRDHPAHQPAVDPGSRHHRRHGDVDSGQGRREQRADRGRCSGIPRPSAAAAGAHRHHIDLQCVFAATARRRRSRQSRDAGRSGRGRLFGDADDVRLALCLAIQQVQPPLAGDRPGRAVLPPQARRHRAGLRAQQERQHDSAQGGGADKLCHRTGYRDPVQQLSRRQDHRRRRDRL